jgi:heptosyltransferase-2
VTRFVILAPNWLGDAVMALPAIADVRRQEASASITVAARAAVAPLFELVPGVDRVVVLDGSRDAKVRARRIGVIAAWRELGQELRDQGPFETAILLPNSYRTALMASRAGIPEVWGYRTDWRGRLLTRAVAAPRGVHQADYYRELVRALGFPNGDAHPTLVVGETHRALAGAGLTDAGWDGRVPLVALAAGAAYGGAKRWPPERFAELTRGLGKDGIATVLVGSREDGEVARAIVQLVGSNSMMFNLVGATSLPALAGVFSQCRAVVSNDSGAMHVAAAVGVPVTAVFGPTNEHATAPRAPHVTILTHPVWCRPCMMRECPIDHRCMRGIPASRVRETLEAR